MRGATVSLAGLAAMLAGAIFGFFYAWSFVVMRGLDASDARAAIAAMQGINASVRNGWFALIFFGTPVATLAAGILSAFVRARVAG